MRDAQTSHPFPTPAPRSPSSTEGHVPQTLPSGSKKLETLPKHRDIWSQSQSPAPRHISTNRPRVPGPSPSPLSRHTKLRTLETGSDLIWCPETLKFQGGSQRPRDKGPNKWEATPVIPGPTLPMQACSPQARGRGTRRGAGPEGNGQHPGGELGINFHSCIRECDCPTFFK